MNRSMPLDRLLVSLRTKNRSLKQLDSFCCLTSLRTTTLHLMVTGSAHPLLNSQSGEERSSIAAVWFKRWFGSDTGDSFILNCFVLFGASENSDINEDETRPNFGSASLTFQLTNLFRTYFDVDAGGKVFRMRATRTESAVNSNVAVDSEL